MRSRIRQVGDAVVVELDGDADLASVPQLAQILTRAGDQAESNETIIVDLDGLTLLDDSALGQLVGAAATARRRGGELRLRVTGQRLRERLSATRIDQIIDLVE